MIFTQIAFSLAAAVYLAPNIVEVQETLFGEPGSAPIHWLKATLGLALLCMVAAAAWECSGLAIYWITPNIAGLGL